MNLIVIIGLGRLQLQQPFKNLSPTNALGFSVLGSSELSGSSEVSEATSAPKSLPKRGTDCSWQRQQVKLLERTESRVALCLPTNAQYSSSFTQTYCILNWSAGKVDPHESLKTVPEPFDFPPKKMYLPCPTPPLPERMRKPVARE